MDTPKHWILGLDLRPGAEGPLVFANWLQSQLPDMNVQPVHVIEAELLAFLEAGERGRVRTALEEAAKAKLEAIDWQGGALKLVPASNPEDALEDAAEDATGLILGRLAPRREKPLIRLGRVARRLLRRLPAPTIVVPPDLQTDQIGAGPVVLATDLTDSCANAIAFAKTTAAALGRPLAVAHVVSLTPGGGFNFLAPETVDRLQRQLHGQGVDALARWLGEQNLDIPDDRRWVSEGVATQELCRACRTLEAVMLVCGSRQLNAIGRLFVTPVGSELAASSACPVAIVG